MPSTFSSLKIELIATGEQSGTWGATTNTNLGTAIEEAITGSADVTFTNGNDTTVTLTDTNAAQAARNLRLNLIGSSTGAQNLILGSGCQIEKLYLINNTLGHTITVKNTTGTGVAVPAGKTMFVYNNGTNVVDAVNHLTSLSTGAITSTQVNITGQGDLRLEDTTGGEYVALQAPGTLASSYTLTMPVDDGTNGQALITDGNGNLSWSTAASGDVYGPASATDNAIARFDLTTGKLIQNSSALVDDAGNVLAGAGLVGAPAFSTTGDTNTGIFFPAADTIAFTEGGVESMRIDSAGNLGLGTSSPTTKFQINTQDGFRFDVGAGATSYMRFGSALTGESTAELSHSRSTGSTIISSGNSGSALTNRLTIDVNGFVGINNSTPLHILDVAGSVIRLNAASGQTNIILQQAGTTNGFLNAAGGAGTDLGVYANRFLTLRGTDAVIFYSNQTTERMRLDSSGNLGIGTSSIGARLDVSGTPSSSGSMGLRVSDGGRVALFQVTGSAYSYNGVGGQEVLLYGGGGPLSLLADGQPIKFCAGSAERMRIDSSGNVGIGTNSPATLLNLSKSVSGGLGPEIRLNNDAGTADDSARISFAYATSLRAALDMKIHPGGNGEFIFSNGVGTLTERMRITSSGFVGIRTAGPSTFLEIFNGTGSTTPALRVSAQDGVGDDNICIGFYETTKAVDMARVGGNYVSNSGGGYGNLDLYATFNGVCSPFATLDSYGNFALGERYPETYLGSNQNSSQFATVNSAVGRGDIWLIKKNSGTTNQRSHQIRFDNYAPAGFARADNTILGGMYFAASQPTSGALQDAGAIYCTSESQSGNSTSSGLSFFTNSGNTGNVLAMYINSGRYVGFGTRSPSYRITTDSVATNDADILLRKSNSGTANQNGQALRFWNFHPANTGRNDNVIAGELFFGFSQPTSGNIQDAGQILVRAAGSQAGTSTASKMQFWTCSGTSNAFAMYLTADQRMGVGSEQVSGRVTAYQSNSNSFTCVTTDGVSSADYGINWRIDNQNHEFARIRGGYTSSSASGYGYLQLQTRGGGALTAVLTANENATVTFNQYGAGTLSTNGSGVISASDGRYKTKTRGLDNALDKVKQLAGLTTYYRWNEGSPWASATQEEEIGWVAQDVGGVIPEASPEPSSPEQFRNYHDRAILAYLTKALADLAEEFEQYKATHP